MYITWFSKIKDEDVDLFGKKGCMLAQLHNDEFPVPLAFMVSRDAFTDFLDASDLRDQIESKLAQVDEEQSNLQEVANAIQKLIIDQDVPQDLRLELLDNYDDFDTVHTELKSTMETLGLTAKSESPVCVKTSMHCSKDINGSPKNATLLNARGEGEIMRALKTCYAAAFTLDNMKLRLDNKLALDDLSPGVIFQLMVYPQKSGLIFTNKSDTEYEIQAGFGLSEAITSGGIIPDSYTVNKDSFDVTQIHINPQMWKYTIDRSIGKIMKEPLSTRERDLQVLNKEEAHVLARMARKISAGYSNHLEIEWCLDRGKAKVINLSHIGEESTVARVVAEQESQEEQSHAQPHKEATPEAPLEVAQDSLAQTPGDSTMNLGSTTSVEHTQESAPAEPMSYIGPATASIEAAREEVAQENNTLNVHDEPSSTVQAEEPEGAEVNEPETEQSSPEESMHEQSESLSLTEASSIELNEPREEKPELEVPESAQESVSEAQNAETKTFDDPGAYSISDPRTRTVSEEEEKTISLIANAALGAGVIDKAVVSEPSTLAEEVESNLEGSNEGEETSSTTDELSEESESLTWDEPQESENSETTVETPEQPREPVSAQDLLDSAEPTVQEENIAEEIPIDFAEDTLAETQEAESSPVQDAPQESNVFDEIVAETDGETSLHAVDDTSDSLQDAPSESTYDTQETSYESTPSFIQPAESHNEQSEVQPTSSGVEESSFFRDSPTEELTEDSLEEESESEAEDNYSENSAEEVHDSTHDDHLLEDDDDEGDDFLHDSDDDHLLEDDDDDHLLEDDHDGDYENDLADEDDHDSAHVESSTLSEPEHQPFIKSLEPEASVVVEDGNQILMCNAKIQSALNSCHATFFGDAPRVPFYDLLEKLKVKMDLPFEDDIIRIKKIADNSKQGAITPEELSFVLAQTDRIVDSLCKPL